MRKLATQEDVQNLLFSSTMSAALGTAIETGLLWMLAEMPMNAKGVADVLNIPARRCQYWLQLLEEMGIVEKASHGYMPSALAHSALLEAYSKDNWKHLVMDERERSAGVQNLALFIREPGSVWRAQGLTQSRDYVEKMRADSQRAREFTRLLFDLHQKLANELVDQLDLTGVRRLMDVGGGSGVVSLALLRKYPALSVTVADIENVCIAGREIAAEASLSERIVYQPVDFDKDEFPQGFDMILLCDVGIFGESFFRKLCASLNEDGQLVIASHFADSEDLAPVSRLEWTFLDSLADPNFFVPTIAQTHAQLLDAGFCPLSKEYALTDNRIVIQAHKRSETANCMALRKE